MSLPVRLVPVCGICGHDGAVNAAFGADVPQCFVLCHMLVCASDFMMLLLVDAGGTSVPEWDVIAAGETIIMVVVPFNGIRWLIAPVVASFGCWFWRNGVGDGFIGVGCWVLL